MNAMVDEPDFLDEIVTESTQLDPLFPALLAAAEARRALIRDLVKHRQHSGLTQMQVADRMKTSQSAIARLESLDDAKESMIDRYASAIGVQVQRTITAAHL